MNEDSGIPETVLIPTGVPGLDSVLDGGLPGGRTYLVHGDPGVGKTTLGLQFLLAGRDLGEAVLYVGLSETRGEIGQIAGSHGWSLDGVGVADLQDDSDRTDSDYTFFHPSEIELRDTTARILEEIEAVGPRRIVFDSLSELRLMARESLRYRRQILFLKRYLSGRDISVLLLDSLSAGTDALQAATLAAGVFVLEKISRPYGPYRRRLRVEKLRGASFQEGYHDLELQRGGLRVHPRLRVDGKVPATAGAPFLSGLEELDALTGGGFERGTVTMIIGPSGVGKSTLASQYAMEALVNGEKVAVYLFEEDEGKWMRRVRWLGFDGGEEARRSGRLLLQQLHPAEMSPGYLSSRIREAVDGGASIVVIDGLSGYLASSSEGESVQLHLHELFSYLNQRRVLTLATQAQAGILGEGLHDPFELSFLADNVLLLRYFEAFGAVRKAVAVIKKRTGAHEQHIRELHLGPEGLELGRSLVEFQGVMSGQLTFLGTRNDLVDD